MHALNRDDSSRLSAITLTLCDWHALVLVCIYTLLLLVVASIPCAGPCSRVTVEKLLRDPRLLCVWSLSLLLLWGSLRLHGTSPRMAFVLLLPLAIVLPGLIFFDHRHTTFANTQMMTDIVYSQATVLLCAALLWLRPRCWRR